MNEDSPRDRSIELSARNNPAFSGDPENGEVEIEQTNPQANGIHREEARDTSPVASFTKKIAETILGPDYGTRIRWALYLTSFLLYNAYLVTGIVLTYSKCPTWCDGIRLLTLITSLVYICILFALVKPFVNKGLETISKFLSPITNHKYCVTISWLVLWVAILAFVIVDSNGNQIRLRSLAGGAVIVFLGWIISNRRTEVNWHQVQCSLMLQFVMGIIVLRIEVGRQVLNCAGDKVSTFLSFANEGAKFVFGYLVDGKVTDGMSDTSFNFGGVFFFHVLPVVFFFAFFVEILYFYGVMQRLVLSLGSFLQATIGTTAVESVSASANIFLGMSEAPMMIKPFFPSMTRSELHAVMTGGFSTVSGSVMAAYISFGISAQHLLTASFMSAPAALGMAKLLYPETQRSVTCMEDVAVIKSEARSALEAAANGASDALSIVGNITANLICFLAALAFLNSALDFFASAVGIDGLTIEMLFGYVFTPLAFILGVPVEDCAAVGELLGLKTFANEFIAYKKLADIKDSLSERAVVLSTYALCGFSNIGSVGILLGASIAMCPQRAADFAQVIIRALVGGTAACLLTACVAGSLVGDSNDNPMPDVSTTTIVPTQF